jgi:hypothetical protein
VQGESGWGRTRRQHAQIRKPMSMLPSDGVATTGSAPAPFTARGKWRAAPKGASFLLCQHTIPLLACGFSADEV